MRIAILMVVLLFGVVGCDKADTKKPTGTASVSAAPAFTPSTTEVKKTTLTIPTTTGASSTTVTTSTETTPATPTPAATATPSTK